MAVACSLVELLVNLLRLVVCLGIARTDLLRDRNSSFRGFCMKRERSFMRSVDSLGATLDHLIFVSF